MNEDIPEKDKTEEAMELLHEHLEMIKTHTDAMYTLLYQQQHPVLAEYRAAQEAMDAVLEKLAYHEDSR